MLSYPSSLKQLRSSSVSSPAISILVRVKNEARAIPEFLRRLKDQANYQAAELVFLDSGSTDATLQLICGTDCTVYQISPQDFTFGNSCNLLMSLSRASICLFLSGHVLLQTPGVLEAVFTHLSEIPRGSLFLRQVPGALSGSSAYERAFLARRFPAGNVPVVLTDPAAFSNAASALTRQSWEELPFPEVAASEDFLWAQQHLSSGGTLLYLPHYCVEHSHCETPEEVYRRVRLNVEARALGSSPVKAAKFFLGVFGASMWHGASLPEALKYAWSHARAYLS